MGAKKKKYTISVDELVKKISEVCISDVDEIWNQLSSETYKKKDGFWEHLAKRDAKNRETIAKLKCSYYVTFDEHRNEVEKKLFSLSTENRNARNTSDEIDKTDQESTCFPNHMNKNRSRCDKNVSSGNVTENLVNVINLFDVTNSYPNEFPDKIKLFGISLSTSSLETLNSNTCIDDNVIDTFLLLLQDHGEKTRGLLFLPFPCILVKSLMNPGNELNLKSWAKNVRPWEKHLWLLPVHKKKHWTLLLVFPKLKKIMYLDSLKKTTPSELISGVCWFMNLITNENEKINQGIDWNKWSLYEPQDIPKQRDGIESKNNCGTFVLSWSNLVCTGLPYEFHECDMNVARRGITMILYGSKTSRVQDDEHEVVLASLFSDPRTSIRPQKQVLKKIKTAPGKVKTCEYLVSSLNN